jgi:hypothetical protein
MADLGRMLLIVGAMIALVGAVLLIAGRVPGLGRLPGDIEVHRGNWSFYFPLGTSIVLSVLLTLVLWLVHRR